MSSGLHETQLAALTVLQSALARLYQVDGTQDVSAFVVDEALLLELARSGAITPREGAREEVFVLEEGQDVSIALYLDERAREAASDAVHGEKLSLPAGRFADFCVALEGISHFVLMSHRADHGRTVTQLELELQAEVDKYVVARLFPWRESLALSAVGEEPRVTLGATQDARAPGALELQEAIFENYSLADHLHHDQAERYRTASRLAHRFCRGLEERFLRSGRMDALLRALREFYRKTQTERLQLIAALG